MNAVTKLDHLPGYLIIRTYLDSRMTRDEFWKKANDAFAKLAEHAAQVEALKFSVASLSDSVLAQTPDPPEGCGVFESENACNAEMQLMRSFRKFAGTVADSERNDFFHPINRKRWTQEFSFWLVRENSK